MLEVGDLVKYEERGQSIYGLVYGPHDKDSILDFGSRMEVLQLSNRFIRINGNLVLWVIEESKLEKVC